MPDAHALSESVEAVSMELPGQPGRTSWSYLLNDAEGRVHLIDCGADSPANRRALIEALARRGRVLRDVSSVTGTHLHFDHIGMAAHIRRESGARVQLHRRDVEAMRDGLRHGGPQPEQMFDRWGVPDERRPELRRAARKTVASGEPVVVDRVLEDGDVLDTPGWRLEVLATPGHTPGHICVVDRIGSTAFVGDHVLPDQNPGPGLGGETVQSPTQSYLDSLERLCAIGVALLLPGHGSRIESARIRISQIYAHHMRRRAEVAAVYVDGASVWQIAARVRWSGGWETLAGMRLFSALRQVDDHLAVTRVSAAAGVS